MALSDYAKTQALEYARAVWQAARPQAYLGEGSEITHTVLLPLALIHAALHQEIEVLRQSYLGRASELSEEIVAMLATNIPNAVWPSGARSTTTVRIYVSTAVLMRLDTAPYFRTPGGIQFRPIAPVVFRAVDFRRDDAGELYVDVVCSSVDFGVQASAGDVSLFVDLPDEVRRVENIDDATGGRARASALEFYEEIKRTRSDGSLVQAGGTIAYVRKNFEQVRRVEVVGAGDAQMFRDEIWSVDGVTPNFTRSGAPLATHTDLGVLDFDAELGRARAASDVFAEGDVGRRVAVTGDEERYRTILRYISPRIVVLSGDPLHGSAPATMWGDGPHTGGMADIYAYIPLLHASYIALDRRLYMELTVTTTTSDTRLYIKAQQGRVYTELPAAGVAVVSPGTTARLRVSYTSVGSDAQGTYIQIVGTIGVIFNQGARVDLWPQTPIEISPDGDITSCPVLFVAQVQELDEITLEPVRDVSETAAGPYAAPGWRMVTPDGDKIFSSKEQKQLVLDTKRGFASHAPLNLSGCSIVGSSQVTGQADLIERLGYDFSYMEGREATLTIPERDIAQANILAVSVTAKTTTTLTLTGANIRYHTEDEWRTGLTLQYNYLGAPQTVPARGRGDVVERTDGGNFPGNVGDYSSVAVTFSGPTTKPAYQLEAVIVRAGLNQVEVLVTDGLKAISGTPDTLVQNVALELADEQGQFDASPVGVTFFTHPDFALMQEAVDTSSTRLNARDQLVRSYLPALIDLKLEYRGQATPEALQRRLVSLIQEADSARVDDQDLRLDISDVLGALDQEGYTSSYQADFEARVTSWLPDGERVVRYLNPSTSTRQQCAIAEAATAGATRVRVRQTQQGAPAPSGRGKVALGGLNPDTQELKAYEAVIDEGSGVYTLILRGDQQLDYNHPQWEGATVGVRDWDPELEFGAEIVVPSVCRPYLGRAVLIRRT